MTEYTTNPAQLPSPIEESELKMWAADNEVTLRLPSPIEESEQARLTRQTLSVKVTIAHRGI